MKKITICGSIKNYKTMMQVAEELELSGNCVLTPIYNESNKDKISYTKEEIDMLSKAHKEKIKISDAIYVIDVDNYIGESTRSEIDYATSLNKEIIYYSNNS